MDEIEKNMNELERKGVEMEKQLRVFEEGECVHSLSLTHTHSLSLSHSYTHTQTHILSLIHTHTHTHTHTQIWRKVPLGTEIVHHR